MMFQHPTLLLSAILVCVLSLQGNPAHAQEDMVSDTDEIEVSTERGGDEMLDSDDMLADEVIESEDDWLEDGKDYASRKANEMTQWVDNFFGNDERDLEQALSTTGMSDSITRSSSGWVEKSPYRRFPNDWIWCFVAKTWTTSAMTV